MEQEMANWWRGITAAILQHVNNTLAVAAKAPQWQPTGALRWIDAEGGALEQEFASGDSREWRLVEVVKS